MTATVMAGLTAAAKVKLWVTATAWLTDVAMATLTAYRLA